MLSALGPCLLSLATVFGEPYPEAASEPPAPAELQPICAAVFAEQMCAAPTPAAPQTGCTCTVQAELAPAALEGGRGGLIGGAVAVHVLGTSAENPGQIDSVHLALRVGARWVDFGEVANGYEPGAFGIHNQGRVTKLTLAPAKGKLAYSAGGNGALLLVETENHHADSDMGTNAFMSTDVKAVLVCGQIASRVACAEVVTDFTDSLARANEDDPDPPVADYGKVGTKHWSRTVTPVGDGRVKLAAGKGKPPATEHALRGSLSVVDLLGRVAGDARRDPLAPDAPPQ